MRSCCDRPIHLLFAFRRTIHNLSRVKQDGWETMSSEWHFANAHLEVVTDQVQTPTRLKPRSWTVVHRKAAVIIAPMTREGKIVLICQERIPIRATIWEMPSGQIDNSIAGVGDPRHRAAEKIEQVALRELREEAGYELAKDGELIPLGYYFTSPGFTDERGYFFLARPVEPCPDYVRDEEESILDCRAFSVPEIRRMIAENEIRDANTLSICARLATRGFLSLELR
jgi:ADP-ribose pyrophosphatase